MSHQLVKFHQITKSYGPLLVLDHISLTISRGDRLAIVGENGCGKTTLARLILQKELPDDGKIEFSPGLQIGYLPQETTDFLPDAKTIQGYLLESLGEIQTLSDRMRTLESVMAQKHLPGNELKKTMDEWNDLYERLEQKNGFAIDHALSTVLAGLHLDKFPLDTPLKFLSGGEKTRVAIASLLLSSPDLLLLDEPTNHLDIAAVEWLEEYLSHYQGAVCLITHDRMFLNRLATKIIELSKQTHQISTYGGNYDDYLEEKKREKERQMIAYEEQKEEMASLKQLIKGKTHSTPKAKGSTDSNKMAYDRRGERHLQSQRRILEQAKAKLEKLQDNPLDHPLPKTVKGIVFHPKELLSHQVLEFTDLTKHFGSTLLFKNAHGSLNKKDRIILEGANGSGKTTFLKILMGLESPDHGSVKIAPSVSMGYLDQELEMIEKESSVQEGLANQFGLSETELRSELHKSGLLNEMILHQKISDLSLGQRKKLLLLKLMLSKCNVLLLDEPTNHLDLKTLEELEEALIAFPGAILAVSHDRWFISRFATHCWRLEGGLLQQNG